MRLNLYWLPMLGILLWLGEGSARAQEQSVLVLPVTRRHEALKPLQDAADDLIGALPRRGLRALPLAAESFEANVSHPAIASTEQDAEVLVAERLLAERAVAYNHFSEALQHARLALQAVEASLESANRRDELAREYLRACAIEVRALASGGEDEAARRAVQRCRAAVPDLAPLRANTPPFVIKLFEEADQSAHLGALRVGADKDGCRVFQSGRDLGSKTPASIAAPLDQQVRVQVQCAGERISRVHRLTLTKKVEELWVDTSLDSAVQTSDGQLRLEYDHLDGQQVRNDALAIARNLGAAGAILISYRAPRVIELQYVAQSLDPAQSKALPLPVPHTEAALRASLDGLFAPRDELPQRAAAPTQEAGGHGLRWRRAKLGVGAAFLAASAVTLALTATRFAHYRDKARVLRSAPSDSPSAFAERGDAWWSARSAPLLWGSVTSGLGTLAAGFLVGGKPRAAYPWLGALSGAAASALLVVGGLQVASADPCRAVQSVQDAGRCTRAQERRDRGTLYLLGAAPLLTVSVLQFAYGRPGRDVSLAASPQNVQLSVKF